MKILDYDVAVIGGGPAGLSAALKANEIGAKVAILERNPELGGILNQCIHSGFGLQYFKKELTGPEYAEMFINKILDADIDVYLNTMVTDITYDRTVTAVNSSGILKINAGSILLAMGCRERTRGAIMIPGSRPAGIFTAGQAQRYMNIDNLKLGSKVVILGSGDIGLIMARRLTLEGIKVLGVYEIMPYPNGLYRNIKHCLEDFNIPLHLSSTVINVIGNNRLESVVVSKVDKDGNPIPGTEEKINCDTLLLSIGLIPENELSLKAGVLLNPLTNGPIVNDKLETSIPGIFACGNVLHVHDLVDEVTKEAEYAGVKAAYFSQGKIEHSEKISIMAGKNIRYTVPNYISAEHDDKINMYFRVNKPILKGNLVIKSNGKILLESKSRSFRPNKMESICLTSKLLKGLKNELYVDIKEEIN